MTNRVYIEPRREIPIVRNVDVLVVGGGPSGVAAAVSAARTGAKTMLIEQQGTVGGMSTAGLMSHWTGSVESKMFSEIIRESARCNEGTFHEKPDVWINPEKLKNVYWNMLSDAGVEVWLYTVACLPIVEDGRVAGVITESKSGRSVLRGKIIIDASGDGDIAAASGVEYQKGREEDGKMQPATLMFKVAGVDTSRAVYLHSFESTFETPKGELQQLARKHLPNPAGHVLLYPTTLPGVVTCNMTNCVDVDGTDVLSLTRAEAVCRGQLYSIEAFLREYVPGYEKCFIVSSASLIGIRETRHFKGVYQLTQEDILQARQFEDWVVRGAHFNFDVHNLTGSGLDETGVQKHFPHQKSYTIPYRCMVPEKIENLLLCGRNISGTHMAHSNFRAMPICAAIGESAGIAAALCATKNIPLRKLAAAEIQSRL